MYDTFGTPMPDRYQWISNAAYYLWKYRKTYFGVEDTLQNWLDAEWQYEQLMKHNKQFHETCDIRG